MNPLSNYEEKLMKTIFIMLTILALIASVSYALNEPEESMILYVSFDALSNDDQAIDHSMYENHGDLKGGPELVAGQHGKAIKLDGSSQWVEIMHHESLTVDENVTVMAWINVERHSGPNNVNWQGIISKGNSPRSYSFYTHLPTKCLHFSVGPAGGFTGSNCSTAIDLNKWVHVAVHQEDGTQRYWVNGEFAGESGGKTNLPGASDTSNVFIGTSAEGAGRLLLGMIDEVRVWKRALSEDEIKEQMGKGHFELFPVDPQQKLTTTWGTIKTNKR